MPQGTNSIFFFFLPLTLESWQSGYCIKLICAILIGNVRVFKLRFTCLHFFWKQKWGNVGLWGHVDINDWEKISVNRGERKDDVFWSGNGNKNSIRKNWKEIPVLLSVTPVSFSSTEEVRDPNHFTVWISKVKSFSWGSTWYLKRGYSSKNNKWIQESWVSFVTKKVRLDGHATLSSGLQIFV